MDEPLGCQEVFFFFIDDYFSIKMIGKICSRSKVIGYFRVFRNFSMEKLWFFTK